MSEDWEIWLTLCGAAFATVTLIASAVAIHSPHFDAHSVLFADVLTLGIEMLATTVVNFFRWLGDMV